MKKDGNKKTRLLAFQKYFLAVAALIFLPVTTLFLLLIHTTTQEFADYMKQNEVQQLSLLEKNLAAEFYNDSEIVENLQIYQNVRPFYLQHSPSNAADLIHNLNNHFTNNNIVDEIYMHFFCDEYFYSTQTSYSMRSFMSQFDLPYGKEGRGMDFLHRIEQAQSAQDIVYLRDVEPRQSVSSEEHNRAILYGYPYEVDGSVVGCVIFQINEANLNSWIGNSEGRDTYIFNARKELLNVPEVDGAAAQRLSGEWIDRQMEQTLRGVSLKLNREGYYVLSGAIADTGLYYLRLVKNDTLFSALQKIQRIYLILLLLLLACGSSAIAFLWKPLRKLRNAFAQTPDPPLNVVDTFLDSYNDLRATNLQFQDEMNASLRRDFLLELLNSDAHDTQQVLKKGKEFGVPLHAPYHFVAIGGKGFETEQAVRAAFPQTDDFLYLIPVQEHPAVVSWIIGMERYVNAKSLRKAAVPRRLSVGGAHTGWAKIHASYVEARSEWDISNAPQQYYRQMEQSIDGYYKEQLQLAREQLIPGGAERFRAAIQAMRFKMGAQGVPQDIQCQIWVKMILAADKALREQPAEGGPEPADPAALIASEDPGALFEFLLAQTEALARRDEERAPPPLTLEEVLRFVQENYAGDNFSLQLAADHFGVSLSYLSLFFKEHHGETLLNYYTGLRMKKARELLEHTQLPLKEIVEAVGYSNPSSFIRRFKQLYGVTPGEYKKAQGKRPEPNGEKGSDLLQTPQNKENFA